MSEPTNANTNSVTVSNPQLTLLAAAIMIVLGSAAVSMAYIAGERADLADERAKLTHATVEAQAQLIEAHRTRIEVLEIRERRRTEQESN